MCPVFIYLSFSCGSHVSWLSWFEMREFTIKDDDERKEEKHLLNSLEFTPFALKTRAVYLVLKELCLRAFAVIVRLRRLTASSLLSHKSVAQERDTRSRRGLDDSLLERPLPTHESGCERQKGIQVK